MAKSLQHPGRLPTPRPAASGRGGSAQHRVCLRILAVPSVTRMDAHDVRSLLQKLNESTALALEAAAGLCIDRGHYEVGPAHVLLALLDRESDVAAAVRNDSADPAAARAGLVEALEGYRTGNTGPADVLAAATGPGAAGLGLGDGPPRGVGGPVGPTCWRAALADGRLGVSEAFAPLRSDALRERFDALTAGSDEGGPRSPSAHVPAASASGPGGPLDEVHHRRDGARAGRRDRPGVRARPRDPPDHRRPAPAAQEQRDAGRRGRRRARRPWFEGLALRMAQGDVPDALRDTDLRALDLARLQAGASG